jgi:replication factor C small subunit
MDEPLWTDVHAPDVEDLPQDDVREYLERATEEPMNLLVYGPAGAGKTAAVRALARASHDDADNDLVEINVADFFGRTKKEIRNDPRFSRFLQGEIPWVRQLSQSKKQDRSKRYKSDWSKAAMINHVVKESAAQAPSSGDYKTILLDNAEAIREDFQQALRRVMERYHETTQFVIATRQPAKLIPPLKSRCFPVPVRSPTTQETVEVLRDIVEAEGVEYDEDGLEFVAGYAGGNLRKAILGAQTASEEEGQITMQAAYEVLQEVGVDDQVKELLDAAEAGEFTDARSVLDDLLVDEGLSGEEVLREMLDVGRSRYDGDRLARLHELAGDVDFDLAEGSSDRVHVGHLLAEWGVEA